jgi:DNA-binding NarL/FixJ family response regulator
VKSDRIRIVFADDHATFRRGLRELLELERDFEVVAECGDGDAALAAIERERPDIALLDFDMPGKDGFAVVRALRERDLDTPVVLLTMHGRDDLLREAFALGVRGYVVKDGFEPDVVHAIRAIRQGQPFISSSLSASLLTAVEGAASPASPIAPELQRLTPAEMRVLRLIAEFKTSKEIANDLGISYRTVENHRANIAAKLNLEGSRALSRFAALHRESLGRS